MSTFSKEVAIQKMLVEVQTFGWSDIVDVYNEFFPEKPLSADDSEDVQVRKIVLNHIQHKLAPEEVVDIWNVVFPKHHNVWYDYEASELHVNGKPERIETFD